MVEVLASIHFILRILHARLNSFLGVGASRAKPFFELLHIGRRDENSESPIRIGFLETIRALNIDVEEDGLALRKAFSIGFLGGAVVVSVNQGPFGEFVLLNSALRTAHE